MGRCARSGRSDASEGGRGGGSVDGPYRASAEGCHVRQVSAGAAAAPDQQGSRSERFCSRRCFLSGTYRYEYEYYIVRPHVSQIKKGFVTLGFCDYIHRPYAAKANSTFSMFRYTNPS